MALEKVKFRLGGEDVWIPAINLDALDRCKDFMQSLSPDMPPSEYAKCVLRIAAASLNDPERPAEVLISMCLAGEVSGITSSFTKLMRASGFDMGEESAVMESGILTSNPSSPISPRTEFVEGTLIESR